MKHGGIALIFLAILLLLIACFIDGVFWLLFQFLFLGFAILPQFMGAPSSHGTWGAIGDFLTGIFLVSLFAFPFVLYHANQVISESSLISVTASTLCFLFGISFIIHSHVQTGNELSFGFVEMN